MAAFAAVMACLTFTCGGQAQPAAAPLLNATVVRTFPHDPMAFTQGLEFSGDTLYESTGMVGRSWLRKVDLETGRVLEQANLAPPYFGEGITIVNGRIVQLTWQHQTGFVYKLPGFAFIKQFNYPGEGWGLTNDGKQIYMSDGTSQIRVLDPDTFKELKRISVTDAGTPVSALNELEWMDGVILANVWMTDRIARIDPATGRVTGWIDLSHLPRNRESADVLNGIAYDARDRRLIVTGKQWDHMYQIEVTTPGQSAPAK